MWYSGAMRKRSCRALERMVRDFSNHRRIEILQLLKAKPELSLEEIAEELHVNYKTAAEHVRRLALAGLVLKRNEAHTVRHKVTSRAIQVLKFLRTLE